MTFNKYLNYKQNTNVQQLARVEGKFVKAVKGKVVKIEF